MIPWSQGLFGFTAHLQPMLDALQPLSAQALSADREATPPQTPPVWDGDLSMDALTRSYRAGLSPVAMLDHLYDRIEAYEKVDPAVWIHLVPRQTAIDAARELLARLPDVRDLPALFGMPFSVKDSIDVAGVPTTTACPPLLRIPAVSAVVVEKVLAQGALFLGKVNLDQFATGLTGCRSPYGITRSVFSHDHISGGSSSGSAVSVGARLVTFSLATDTAGSGRVPAAFNGVVGFKPTRGTVSFCGVTPACLSLDCCSFMAGSVSDARQVWLACAGYDEQDPYAKPTPPIQHHVDSIGPRATAFNFGIPPPSALTVCSVEYRARFHAAVQQLQSIENAGQLLYDGSFVTERLASLPDGWLETNREHLHPVIVKILEDVVNRQSTAIQAYRDLQAKALYTRQAEKVFASGPQGISVLAVPTAPMHWTVAEVEADPIRTNSLLGTFTHCGNVLDLNAVAVPASVCSTESSSSSSDADGLGKLPFGITLLGVSRSDATVLEIARRFERSLR